MGYHLGVDLGTSYTAAAISRDGVLEMVSLGTRSLEIPSVVFLDPSGKLIVGEAAERRGASDPVRLTREFKRRLGDPAPILVGGTPFSAEGLMAAVLRTVIDDVTARQGEPPQYVTLTRPANWGPYKQELFSHVPALADLGAGSTATEPEAAAIHFASTTRVSPGQVVAVYDLGGGTFDAAVLRKTDDGFTTLGTPEGIEHLGGADFDDAVFEYVRRVLGPAFSQLDPTDPAVRVAAARLRTECVLAKESLSRDTEATIPVMLPGLQTEVRLTRQDFEDLVRPSLMTTIESLRRTVRSAKVSPDEIIATVLAGGSSRIPLAAELITGELQLPVAVGTHPKHTVALGAALIAARNATHPVPEDVTGRISPAMLAAAAASGPRLPPSPVSAPIQVPPPPPPAYAPVSVDPRSVAVGEDPHPSDPSNTGSGLFGLPNQFGVLEKQDGRRRRSSLVIAGIAALAVALIAVLVVVRPWGNTSTGTAVVGPLPTASSAPPPTSSGAVTTDTSAAVTTSAGSSPPTSSPSTSSPPTSSSAVSTSPATSTASTAGLIPGLPTGVTCTDKKIAVPGMYSNPPQTSEAQGPKRSWDDALATGALNAVLLAVQQFDTANPGCKVTVLQPDTEHSSATAHQVATAIAADPTVIGVVPASYSSDVTAEAAVFADAGLAFLPVMAKSPGFNSQSKYPSYDRLVGDDQASRVSMAKYLIDDLKATAVVVVDDGVGHSPAIAGGAAKGIGDRLAALLVSPAGDNSFESVLSAVTDKNADAVYFSGDPSRGGLLAKALRDSGFQGTIVLFESVFDVRFAATAGSALDGLQFGCTCAPMEGNPALPGGKEFRSAYRTKYGEDPTSYAPEAFDAALLLLRGLAAGAPTGAETPADIATFVRSYQGDGITKSISFNANGDVNGAPLYLYEMQGGKPKFLAFVP